MNLEIDESPRSQRDKAPEPLDFLFQVIMTILAMALCGSLGNMLFQVWKTGPLPTGIQTTLIITASSLMLTAGSLSQSSRVWRLIRRTVYTAGFGMLALVLWSQMIPQPERASASSSSPAPAPSSTEPSAKLTPLHEVMEQNQIELKEWPNPYSMNGAR